jgi:hypothetical protein
MIQKINDDIVVNCNDVENVGNVLLKNSWILFKRSLRQLVCWSKTKFFFNYFLFKQNKLKKHSSYVLNFFIFSLFQLLLICSFLSVSIVALFVLSSFFLILVLLVRLELIKRKIILIKWCETITASIECLNAFTFSF